MKRLAATLAAIATLALATAAEAQLPSENAARYNIAAQTRSSGATAYGAATAFEEWILPSLGNEGDWVFKFATLNFTRVTTVPALCLTDADAFGSCNGHDYVKLPVSLLSTQVAVGYRWERFGLFYTGSTTKVDFDTEFSGIASAYLRQVQSAVIYNPLLGPFSALSIGGSEVESPVFDYVLGASFDAEYVNIYAGYVGSKGLFANFIQEDTRFAFTGVVNDSLRTLSYLKSGLDRLPWKQLIGEETRALTSAYVRRVVVAPPRSLAVSPSVDLTDYTRSLQYSLTSFHLEEMSLMSLFDATAAIAATKPVTLNELSVGVHTPGFHLPPPPAHPREKDEARGDSGTLEAGLTAGITTLPPLIFYGVKGGTKLSLDLTVRAPWIALSLQRNNPDILAVFPYAYDAWSLSLILGDSSRDALARSKGAQ